MPDLDRSTRESGNGRLASERISASHVTFVLSTLFVVWDRHQMLNQKEIILKRHHKIVISIHTNLVKLTLFVVIWKFVWHIIGLV